MLRRNATQSRSTQSPPPLTELALYLFAFRVVVLCTLCVFLRGSRVCKLRRKVFSSADILWFMLDTLLCADPLAQPPLDPTAHLPSLYYSSRLSLFLFAGTPLFLLAAESNRRGLATLLAVTMAMQRFTTAMLTECVSHYFVAGLSLRPLWIASSLSAAPRRSKERRRKHIV